MKKMTFYKSTFFLFIGFMLINSCCSYKVKPFEYPQPEDTSDKKIELQEKKIYRFDQFSFDNLFDGARLNGMIQQDESTFKAIISPENFPVNNSAWFAFRMKSETPADIRIVLEYKDGAHRYIPKYSYDKINWIPVDTLSIKYMSEKEVIFPFHLDSRPVYLSGQELVTSSDVFDYCSKLAERKDIELGSYGSSIGGRNLFYLDMFQDKPERKPLLIIMGRAHPPELSGHFAMQAYLETILENNVLANAFRKKFRILVFPMINPDGVDMGHWRHNAHGVDLNRDWADYRQKEVKQLADFMVREQKTKKNKVVLCMDFHSTQKDVMYTHVDSIVSVVPGFKNFWLYGLDQAMPDHTPHEEAYGFSQPYAKGWFHKQFKAESIIFEVGDETPRPFIREKAQKSALEMMKLLIFYSDY